MTYTIEKAIDHVAAQSQNGPPFRVGMCKQQTRLAYAVPSDGSGSATEAWRRTDHRLSVAGDQAPRGALLWWTGGGLGYGHVAIADGKGGVWSVDVKRDGYWDHVPFAQIATWAPSLNWAGVSRDIDSVTVVPVPVEKPAAPKPPTYLDLTVALERLAAKSANPRAVVSYTLARRILGSLVSSGDRVSVPTTTAGVVAALTVRQANASGLTKARITAALALLRPLA